jgi:inorganic triphosphatase YgiF
MRLSVTKWNPRLTAAANARRQLPRMMSEYFAEVRDALTKKASPAHLHRIRLASKKIRYTLELFRSCYDAAAFDARLTALKDVQTYLGEVNDAVATARMLSALMPHSPGRRALSAFLKKRAAKKAEEFRKHWTERFDAPGQERWWTEFLEAGSGARHGAKNGADDATKVHRSRASRDASRQTRAHLLRGDIRADGRVEGALPAHSGDSAVGQSEAAPAPNP